MFPKTVIAKKDKYSEETMADYNSITKTIRIFKKSLKDFYPSEWRRRVIAFWFHEFTHHLQNINTTDLIELYLCEIQAYKVQFFIENILLLSPSWESPEEGAVSSIAGIVHEAKIKGGFWP